MAAAANAGKYEGADGAWKTVNVTSTAPNGFHGPQVPECRVTVFDGCLGIQLPASLSHVKLIDMHGKTILAKQTRNALLIPRGTIPAGAYVAFVQTGAFMTEQKMMIQ